MWLRWQRTRAGKLLPHTEAAKQTIHLLRTLPSESGPTTPNSELLQGASVLPNITVFLLSKMNLSVPTKFVVLAVLDGWGLAAPGPGNAISQANTVNINRFLSSYPHTSLAASREAVGLPRGEAGNTEMGHLNLGAGHVVYGDLARINMAVADGSFFKNRAFVAGVEHAKAHKSKLHLMGLIGSLGVHSNIDHLFALIHLAREMNFSELFIHIFTDGRDSPPTSAKTFVTKLRDVLKKEGVGQIASIMGRYWAMDRDLRWERTEKAYLALTLGEGRHLEDENLEKAIDESYD